MENKKSNSVEGVVLGMIIITLLIYFLYTIIK